VEINLGKDKEERGKRRNLEGEKAPRWPGDDMEDMGHTTYNLTTTSIDMCHTMMTRMPHHQMMAYV